MVRTAVLRLLLQLRLPEVSVPRVPGAGHFALRRGHAYATVLASAGTAAFIAVLASPA
jgi:hypothetical protein